jgi:hypothetical protein
MLGNGSQDMDGETVRFGHVHGHKIHAAFHEVGDEGAVTRQAVEARNPQRRLLLPAHGKGLGKLRTSGRKTALDLGEGGDNVPAFSTIGRYALALGIET